ncbi:Leucine-rich repeat protein soc-2-like protein [Frankliniella fusca]|uniref:Leucine-rich repeat protein soc-2-like protein n=1 Tax=Frankliniella fusca TaxID=407009 RepID=A0AAE1GSD1_9NEOP|nr:Leucine-rich repeat protein soc-2-like protein [Frankliniella fusca]
MAAEDSICEGEEQTGITFVNGTVLIAKSLMPSLSSLTQLKLNDSRLTEIPDSLGDIPALECLEASHNCLTKLPDSICQLKGLLRLNLSFNQLSELPAGFEQLSALETVNLSHNNFNEPPFCFQGGNVNIKYLNISFNKIETWRHGPLCAYGLKYLNCANNRMISNPPWIWEDFCRSLETLDMSCNEFTNPTATLRPYALWRTGVTVGLKFLQLRNCGVTTDHLSLVHKLRAVEKLDLGNKKGVTCKNNFIWDISFKLFQSCNLSEIHLDGVGLSTLSEDINCLKTLRILNCNNNLLQWLPENIADLENLTHLSLSNNEILYIPSGFGKLVNLQELFLDCNKLEDLPSSFADLKSLQYLDLYGNHFYDIPQCLEKLDSLCGLDLKFNYCETNAREELCINLRQRRGLLNRQDQMQQKPLSSSSHSHSGSYSSFGSETEDDQDCDEEETENAQDSESESSEENWDLEDEDDDHFDPTVYQPKVADEGPRRALIIHATVIGPHSFLPSDIHPSPSIRPNKDPFAPDDGQFEDA